MPDHRKYPLRKIIGTKPHERLTNISHEVLACGHLAALKNDIYGETTATKRRCRKCAKGQPAEVSTEYPYALIDIEVSNG